uniref:Reverse transcriptase domain-containing protein n=1 Tax=Arundo donax TaxID=35708 RepID=A0A0A9TPM1_ARUDO
MKTKYHVPLIDEFLDELANAKWFSNLDLRDGYHQIKLAFEEFKTAFQTHGHFEFIVMAIGMLGAPATFLSVMNTTLGPLLRKCVIGFFDDILVYNPTWESHLTHLKQVFLLLKRDQWQIKLSKCSFLQQ